MKLKEYKQRLKDNFAADGMLGKFYTWLAKLKKKKEKKKNGEK